MLEVGISSATFRKAYFQILRFLLIFSTLVSIFGVLPGCKSGLVNFEDSYLTPSINDIIFTLKKGDLGAIKNYLERGGDPNLSDQEGFTLLMLAIEAEQYEIVNLLLSAQPDLDKKNIYQWTALMVASNFNQIEIVEALLLAGANPNLVNRNGWTALLMTVNNHMLHNNDADDIATLLLQFNASIDIRNNLGNTPLSNASIAGKEKTFKVLLKAGANIENSNSYGVTPLMSAVINGHDNIFEMLLDAGADTNKVSKMGCTALIYSKIYNQSEMYSRLIAAGADPSIGRGCSLIQEEKLVAGSQNIQFSYFREDGDNG